jgi:hypothetical protein
VKDPKRLLPAILFCSFAFALWPSDAAAQRRGHPVRPRSATVGVRPAFYGGYYGYYDPFFWGYSGRYPYGLYAPSYGADVYSRTIDSARLQVTPKHAEVYVDGHRAGTVDDFDGFLQRLDVPAGEHQLTLYLDGYRTIQQQVLFRPGATVKINYAMEPLPQGAPNEPRPQPNPETAPQQGQPYQGRPAQPVRDRPSQADFGTLALRIQPRDAAVFVDGEEWSAPEAPGPVLLELSAGTHEIEVRKQGFTSYRTTVRVRGNEQFFIAEPQIDALWRINGWLRLDAGGWYRAIGGADLLHEQLPGVSGTIALRFGGH